jgi:hypothetical protein
MPLLDPNTIKLGPPLNCDTGAEAGADKPGAYVWWFRSLPPGIDPGPNIVTHIRDGVEWRALYVGIAEGQPIRQRLRFHRAGHAYNSTLRNSVGALYSLPCWHAPAGRSFGGYEHLLDGIFSTCAAVTFASHEEPLQLEAEMLAGPHCFPLNNPWHGAHLGPPHHGRTLGDLRNAPAPLAPPDFRARPGHIFTQPSRDRRIAERERLLEKAAAGGFVAALRQPFDTPNLRPETENAFQVRAFVDAGLMTPQQLENAWYGAELDWGQPDGPLAHAKEIDMFELLTATIVFDAPPAD